jgi:hypothetical protein
MLTVRCLVLNGCVSSVKCISRCRACCRVVSSIWNCLCATNFAHVAARPTLQCLNPLSCALQRDSISLWVQLFAVLGVLAAPSAAQTICSLTLSGAVVQLGCTGPSITVHASPDLFKQLNKTRTGGHDAMGQLVSMCYNGAAGPVRLLRV